MYMSAVYSPVGRAPSTTYVVIRSSRNTCTASGHFSECVTSIVLYLFNLQQPYEVSMLPATPHFKSGSCSTKQAAYLLWAPQLACSGIRPRQGGSLPRRWVRSWPARGYRGSRKGDTLRVQTLKENVILVKCHYFFFLIGFNFIVSFIKT